MAGTVGLGNTTLRAGSKCRYAMRVCNVVTHTVISDAPGNQP